jgi:hypothetical protein
MPLEDLHLAKYASFVYTDVYLWNLYYGLTVLVGLGLLVVQVSRSHSAGHTTLGRTLWTNPSQRPLLYNMQHRQETNIYPPRWDSNPQS